MPNAGGAREREGGRTRAKVCVTLAFVRGLSHFIISPTPREPSLSLSLIRACASCLSRCSLSRARVRFLALSNWPRAATTKSSRRPSPFELEFSLRERARARWIFRERDKAVRGVGIRCAGGFFWARVVLELRDEGRCRLELEVQRGKFGWIFVIMGILDLLVIL